MDDNAVSGFRGIAMVIWKQRADLETLNGWSQRTLMRALDIRIADFGDADVQRTHQGALAPAIERFEIGALLPDDHGDSPESRHRIVVHADSARESARVFTASLQ